MEIGSIRHKSLLAFVQTGKTKGLPGNLIGRLRNMLVWLDAIEQIDELYVPPNYGAHILKGDRAGVWSLTLNRNWRMTFEISDLMTIENLELEDYH